jgi:hypothetical protein
LGDSDAATAKRNSMKQLGIAITTNEDCMA